MRGFWKLAWIELRIFLREPLGVLSTVGVPVIVFIVLGRSLADEIGESPDVASFARVDLPVLAGLLISLSAATSLIAILSIYREAGILRRLRATPLKPQAILSAHVVVKLALTAVTLGLLILAGKRFYPVALEIDVLSYASGLLLATLSLLPVGFLIASAVPTARFAQPVAAMVLYPLIAISGLFVPVAELPKVWRYVAQASPVTHAVSLLEGLWTGSGWSSQLVPIGALVLTTVLCTALSARLFRWE